MAFELLPSTELLDGAVVAINNYDPLIGATNHREFPVGKRVFLACSDSLKDDT